MKKVPARRPARLAAAGRDDLGPAGGARPARRRLRLAAERLAGRAADRQPRVHRDAAPDSGPGRHRHAGRAPAHRHLRHQHRRAVVAHARATACSTRCRSCKLDLQLGASRSRTRCSRAAAMPSARRCWSSTRARARGRSPSSPASRAARRRVHLPGDFLSVYVPTTPNPTSGFFLMLPRSDVIELAMSVDEALKYVISMGVVAPRRCARDRRGRAAAKPGRAERRGRALSPARRGRAAPRAGPTAARPPDCRDASHPKRMHGVT